MNKYFLLLLALVICHFQSAAQALLTAQKAVEIALHNNFGIKIAQNEVLIAQNNVTKGNAGMLPVVALVSGLGYSNTNTKQEFASGSEQNRNFASSYNGNLGVQLNWTLYDGKRMYIAYDRLAAMRDQSQQLLQVHVEQTNAEVLFAWANAVLQQSYIATLLKNMTYYDERLRLTTLRAEAGTTGKSPQLQAQVDKNLQQSNLLQAQNTLQQQKIALNRLLGRAPDTEYTLPERLPELPDITLETITGSSLKDNAMLISHRQALLISLFEVQELQALQRPQVSLIGGYNYLRSQNQAGFLLFNQNYGLNAGVQLTWNLYDGKNTQRQIENAKINQLNTQLRIDELQNELQSNFAIAVAALKNARQIHQIEQENIALALQNLDIAQERFKQGGSDIPPVKEAQKSYEDAQMRQLNALYTAKVEEIKIKVLVGNLNVD